MCISPASAKVIDAKLVLGGMRLLVLLPACTQVVGDEGTWSNLVKAGIGGPLHLRPRQLVHNCGPGCVYPSSTSTVTTTSAAPCYEFLTSGEGGEALYFHKRLSPTKNLVRMGHCRSCGNWDVCRSAAKVADKAFLTALGTGTDFTCDMLKVTSCGNLTQAWPRRSSMPLASSISRSPRGATTWPLLILAILCWTGCAGALAWLLFTHGATHLWDRREDRQLAMRGKGKRNGGKLPSENCEEVNSGTEDEQPLLPGSPCGLPCCSVRSIPENAGAEEFDVVTVGPDGFEVRPAGEKEFDVVTVSPEGYEVRPASPRNAFQEIVGDKAMQTTILEPPMGSMQQGMHTTILEPSMGSLQQGMKTTVLEQPPLGTHGLGMQTTILEQPLLSGNPAMQTTILESPHT